MNSKFLLLIAFSFIIIKKVNAQNNSSNNELEKEAVKAVIKKTFTAMINSDTVLLKSCFATGAVLQIVQNQKDSTIIRTRTAAEFVTGIGKQAPGTLDEKSFDEIIYVDRELATAWAPYTFHLNGKFSHKGIDSFQFVKLKEGWKIQYLIYNMY